MQRAAYGFVIVYDRHCSSLLCCHFYLLWHMHAGRKLAFGATTRRSEVEIRDEAHQVGNGPHPHFRHHAAAMNLDRLLHGSELGGDLLV